MSKRGRYLDKLKKVYLLVVGILAFSLIFSAIVSFSQGNYLGFFTSLVVFVVVLLPSFFRWKYRMRIPLEIEIIIVMFIYATLFLGEVYRFYDLFWWWDILLHAFSALVFGFVGFIVLYLTYSRHELKVNVKWLAFFTFSFAVCIGVLWEIFEFFMDWSLGWNMQKTGLVDTMTDLIVDCVGALIAAGFGYLYIQNKKTFFLKRFFDYLLRG